MSIQDINRYVDSIFNQKLDGSGDLASIRLHFDLMRDRMDKLVRQIGHYTTLDQLKEQPWMDEQMFGFIQMDCHDFLTSSNDINRDISFMQSHPFDQQTDSAKFNIYAQNLMNYMDERNSEHPTAVQIMKGWFDKSKHNVLLNQYLAIVGNKAKFVEGKFVPNVEVQSTPLTRQVQAPLDGCVNESLAR